MAERKVPIPSRKLYCYRCGHVWESDGDGRPRLCPRCRSSVWDVPVAKDAVCPVCGHGWRRTDIRQPCPACGAGMETPGLMHCNQCDHEWIARGEGGPKRCPACHSLKWNQPRTHTFTCHRCGVVWRNRSEHPARCPSCRSTKWDEPAYKLQCRRCGHRWIPREGRTSADVRICPACKSDKWNEPPQIQTCSSCGRHFISRKPSSKPRCPTCKATGDPGLGGCPFCGFEWVDPLDSGVCPRCGRSIGDADIRSSVIWTDGSLLLRYVYTDGMGFVYLWKDDGPIITVYLKDLLNLLGITINQFMSRIGNTEYSDSWRLLAKDMYDHRNDYLGDVSFLSKRLNLDEKDARILAIHFRGMGPEAIAMRFGIPLEAVRSSFDRIMLAFEDNGIVVDDTVFTDDAMSYYS